MLASIIDLEFNINMKKNTGVKVFTRYLPPAQICIMCNKKMAKVIKVTAGGEKTSNFFYICTYKKCSKVANVDQLAKSEWILDN